VGGTVPDVRISCSNKGKLTESQNRVGTSPCRREKQQKKSENAKKRYIDVPTRRGAGGSKHFKDGPINRRGRSHQKRGWMVVKGRREVVNVV